jgi:hypothetical protein
VKRLAAAVLSGLTLVASGGSAALAQDSAESMTLVLPRALAADEIAWIEIQVGPIGGGQEISVTTASGEPLGVVSPFGIRAGQDAGTYSLPCRAMRSGTTASPSSSRSTNSARPARRPRRKCAAWS